MDGYLTKPVREAELRAALARVRAPAPAVDPRVLDEVLAAHRRRRRAIRALRQELVDAYLEQGEVQLPAMRAGLKRGDLGAVATAAHALRSGSAQLGAAALATLLSPTRGRGPRRRRSALRRRFRLVLAEYTQVCCRAHAAASAAASRCAADRQAQAAAFVVDRHRRRAHCRAGGERLAGAEVSRVPRVGAAADLQAQPMSGGEPVRARPQFQADRSAAVRISGRRRRLLGRQPGHPVADVPGAALLVDVAEPDEQVVMRVVGGDVDVRDDACRRSRAARRARRWCR